MWRHIRKFIFGNLSAAQIIRVALGLG